MIKLTSKLSPEVDAYIPVSKIISIIVYEGQVTVSIAGLSEAIDVNETIDQIKMQIASCVAHKENF